jgi:succinyl-CoA synthetase beta subunit
MNVHEYQAKVILKKYGLPIPNEKVFDEKTLSLDEIRSLGKIPLAVKAQIHAGGRGKAGGVKIVDTVEAAFDAAKKMLGTTLATYQTAGVAKPVDRVLIHFAKKIEKELYLAVTLDREKELPCVIFSDAGGMDIEEVAKKNPEKILKCHFEPDGKRDNTFFELFLSKNASGLGPLASRKSELAEFMAQMAKAFVELDISILEINPLALLQDQTFKVIDAKINFDDNALFRHPEIAALHDPRQEDSREVEAKQFDLSYVGLEGNIGCMVNGAGLAMATMDIIKHEGGEPANFLDVGGGATK